MQKRSTNHTGQNSSTIESIEVTIYNTLLFLIVNDCIPCYFRFLPPTKSKAEAPVKTSDQLVQKTSTVLPGGHSSWPRSRKPSCGSSPFGIADENTSPVCFVWCQPFLDHRREKILGRPRVGHPGWPLSWPGPRNRPSPAQSLASEGCGGGPEVYRVSVLVIIIIVVSVHYSKSIQSSRELTVHRIYIRSSGSARPEYHY